MLALKQGLSLNTIKALGGGAAYSNVYSLDFDGINDYVTFLDSAAFSINESGADRGFSISAWFKTSGGDSTMFSKSENSSTKSEYRLNLDRDGKLNFFVYGGGNNTVFQTLRVDTPTVNDGNWYHVGASFNLADASTSLILYINGVEYLGGDASTTYGSNGTWAASSNTTAALEMGRLGNLTNHFGGNIDEVAIFDNVMDQTLATAIYNSGTPTDLSGEDYLLAYWRNGDTAGPSVFPTIEDYSSNGYNGEMKKMDSGDIVTVVP